MAVHLDTVNYLQNTANEDWGNQGTVFCTITPAWDYNDGVQHQLFVKAKAAFDGNGFLFAKGTGSITYVGWFTGGSDYRLVESGGVFGAGRTDNHLFLWNTATPLTQYWWNGTLRIPSSAPFTVPTGVTHFTLGCLFNTTTSESGNATYAEFGRWNRQLSNEEVAILQATGCPLNIPNGLRQYHPLINPSIAAIDLMGNVPLTRTGSPPSIPHSRVFYPATGMITHPTPIVTLFTIQPLSIYEEAILPEPALESDPLSLSPEAISETATAPAPGISLAMARGLKITVSDRLAEG
jgi:hypothetical protein